MLVPTREAVEKLIAARFAADVMGVPPSMLARTDASRQPADQRYDANDKPFLTSRREGFYRVRTAWSKPSAIGVACRSGMIGWWCETGVPTSASPAEFTRACTPCPDSCCRTTARLQAGENLSDSQIAAFQEDLSALGYKYQFITLAGYHIQLVQPLQFAHACARGEA